MISALSKKPSRKTGLLNLICKMTCAFYQCCLLGLAFVAGGGCAMADEYTQPVAMPPITVTATNELAEEAPLGPNQQPEWTARRRFTTTRIYVQPPWQIEVESGWDAQYFRSHKGSPFHLLTQEFELGLPYRFQVDYEYAEAINKDGNGRWTYDSSSFELRWALAEWGDRK